MTNEVDDKAAFRKEEIGTDPNYRHTIRWRNVYFTLVYHVFALFGLYLLLNQRLHLYSYIFLIVRQNLAMLGTTMGAHRLYAHRTFKTTPSIRFLLLFLQTVAGQNSMFIWVRDHRMHHKYSDTDADPHNARRGLFFSHMGWLMVRKHPLVHSKGKDINLEDLKADELLMFQRRYYVPLFLVFSVFIPIMIPIVFWHESVKVSFFTCYSLGYVIGLHSTWLVNSINHLFGMKPYDKMIKPTENQWVAWCTLGEGWHNYHHSFPYDYKAAEFGLRNSITTEMIDLCYRLGWAWDLKEAPVDSISHKAINKGDLSHIKLLNGHI